MSSTEMFYFGEKGEANSLAECSNAWRGAMAVWRTLEQKYLPPGEKNIFTGEPMSRTSSFENEDAIQEIWDLIKDDKVSFEDKIVMGTTFDFVIIKKENLPRVIEAFRNFDKINKCTTSLDEQANALEKAHQDPNCTGVAWNQTSVCSSWVFSYDDDDELVRYNINTGDKHWELFEDKLEKKNKEQKL